MLTRLLCLAGVSKAFATAGPMGKRTPWVFGMMFVLLAAAADLCAQERAALEKEMADLNRQSVAQAKAIPDTGFVAVVQRGRCWPMLVKGPVNGRRLRIGTREYTQALVCDAPSRLVVHLPRPGKTFTAAAGVDNSGAACNAYNVRYDREEGDVVFSVAVGGKLAFESAALSRKTEGAAVQVDLGGSSEFVLKVAGPKPGPLFNWPEWADPKVTLADGRELKLDAMPIRKEQPLGWKCADILIEWGFGKATQDLAFDGQIASTYDLGKVGVARPLGGDAATVMTGKRSWRSAAAGGARRGIVVPVLYTDAVRGPERTIVTVRTNQGSFSFQPADLADGPILAPEYGFFIAQADGKTTAQAFQKELAAKGLKTIRQSVRERPEISWEQSVRAMFGHNVVLPEFPAVPYEPRMSVQVPDKYLTGLWRIGAWQIMRHCPRVKRADVPKIIKKDAWIMENYAEAGIEPVDEKDPEGVYFVGDHPFTALSLETDRILWALDQMGMHEVARDGLSLWLDRPQAKGPDKGALLLDMTMEKAHAAGALHILWVIAEHYRLTGDQEWLRQQAPTLQAAADWIIRRRQSTVRDTYTPKDREKIRRGEQSPSGLQPAIPYGDAGARYVCWADAFAYQSLRELADVMADIYPPAAAKLTAEADRYHKDLAPVLEESIVMSPVVKVRDGTYRSFVPQAFCDRGLLARALPESASLYSHAGPHSWETVVTSVGIESWLRSGMLSAQDPRLDGHFQVLEDVVLADHPWLYMRKADYNPQRDWFLHAGWAYQSPWERLPEFYLAQDDVPNFLRSWLNHCAADLNISNPKNPYFHSEHTTFAPSDKSQGTAAFLSNFRNLLVMEQGRALWLAKATPRAWLEQGKKVAIRNAPTWFGTVAYEIVSDVDNGKINASVALPSRKSPQAAYLRLRHPEAKAIKRVAVNGQPWAHFDVSKEFVKLTGLQGTVRVTVEY